MLIQHEYLYLQLNLGAFMGSNLGAYVLNLGARLKSTPLVIGHSLRQSLNDI